MSLHSVFLAPVAPGRWCRACALAACLFVSTAPPALGQEQPLEDGLREMATAISQTLRDGEIRKIAVVEFQDLNGYTSTLGPFIAEELITQLFSVQPGQFTVVERRQLEKVLKEQELSTSGLFDSTTIAELGSILGIEAIVTGSIADLGTSLKLNCRVISVQSARVFAASSVRVAKDEMVTTLLRQTAAPEGDGSLSDAGPRPVAQSADVFFQNDFVRFTVVSVGAGNRGQIRSLGRDPTGEFRYSVTIGLQVENLTTEALLIAADIRYQRCAISLVTNTGLSMAAEIADAVGLPCLYVVGDKGAYTSIGPKSRSTVTLTFNGGWSALGTSASLGAELFRLRSNGRPEKFSVGLSGITLPRPSEVAR